MQKIKLITSSQCKTMHNRRLFERCNIEIQNKTNQQQGDRKKQTFNPNKNQNQHGQ